LAKFSQFIFQKFGFDIEKKGYGHCCNVTLCRAGSTKRHFWKVPRGLCLKVKTHFWRHPFFAEENLIFAKMSKTIKFFS